MSYGLFIIIQVIINFLFFWFCIGVVGYIKATRQKETINVKWMLDAGAFVPLKAHATDAGYDFFSPVSVEIPAKGSVVVDTGVHWEADSLCWLQMKSRSGLAFKKGIECTNAGVIDFSYRGSVGVKLYNNSDTDFQIEKGDRIAQGIIVRLPCVRTELSEKLSDSDRGFGGFGSTGK